MHIHNVYFWFNEGVNTEERKKFEKGLETLITIPHIKTAYWGVPAGVDREVVDGSFDYSLTMIFESREQHDLYQPHEGHNEFIANYKHLWARVQVYDTKTG